MGIALRILHQKYYSSQRGVNTGHRTKLPKNKLASCSCRYKQHVCTWQKKNAEKMGNLCTAHFNLLQALRFTN